MEQKKLFNNEFIRKLLQSFKRIISKSDEAKYQRRLDYSFRIESDTILSILYILLFLVLQLLVILFSVLRIGEQSPIGLS